MRRVEELVLFDVENLVGDVVLDAASDLIELVGVLASFARRRLRLVSFRLQSLHLPFDYLEMDELLDRAVSGRE